MNGYAEQKVLCPNKDFPINTELAKVSHPDILEAIGIGPCLGMVFYQPKTREGYVAHVHGATHTITHFDMIDKVVDDLGASDLEVTLCGLSPELGEGADEKYMKIQLKSQLRQYLKNKKVTKITEKYGRKPDGVSEIELKTKTGKVKVKETYLDSLQEEEVYLA